MIRLFLLALLISTSSSSFAFVKIQAKDWGFNTFSTLSYADNSVNRSSAQRNNKQLKQRIMREFAQWQGTHYRWGGDSRRGIDCSAFTRRIIASTIHKHLPRTAREQSHIGRRIHQNELNVGDLVFFETKPNVHHVGVYIGNDAFIHASSSEGVTLSHLSSRYWQSRYVTARRVSV
ncbi:C40 family peptidase [Citrobacter sedlakii]|uniref:C40 family peptidase n=1 Tax=Citrobacter TaxID=544 RepID=UPI00190029C9|nr:NlpC/P60 family protein [Citrobacter sedlakii]MBJ9889995.1 C40 family peptidase [Citrobacter sedlakii]MCK8145473.1 NlpC/P60 family protein [Citrobacter sedlakii]